MPEGVVDAELAEELPGLRLHWADVAAPAERSAAPLRERLAELSDRWGGARAVAVRTEPVPRAYRGAFRALGLDPDTDRPPMEEAILGRLLDGGFRAADAIEGALLVGVVETGVGLWALDAATLDGPLGLRAARAGETLGRGAREEDAGDRGGAVVVAPALPGRIVVADARGPLAELFRPVPAAHRAGVETTALRVYAVQVAGVPDVHVEEALWVCARALDAGRGGG